ncbi:hypothetical protein L345_03686, partial [Ophiophagus hannah]
MSCCHHMTFHISPLCGARVGAEGKAFLELPTKLHGCFSEIRPSPSNKRHYGSPRASKCARYVPRHNRFTHSACKDQSEGAGFIIRRATNGERTPSVAANRVSEIAAVPESGARPPCWVNAALAGRRFHFSWLTFAGRPEVASGSSARPIRDLEWSFLREGGSTKAPPLLRPMKVRAVMGDPWTWEWGCVKEVGNGGGNGLKADGKEPKTDYERCYLFDACSSFRDPNYPPLGLVLELNATLLHSNGNPVRGSSRVTDL